MYWFHKPILKFSALQSTQRCFSLLCIYLTDTAVSSYLQRFYLSILYAAILKGRNMKLNAQLCLIPQEILLMQIWLLIVLWIRRLLVTWYVYRVTGGQFVTRALWKGVTYLVMKLSKLIRVFAYKKHIHA